MGSNALHLPGPRQTLYDIALLPTFLISTTIGTVIPTTIIATIAIPMTTLVFLL